MREIKFRAWDNDINEMVSWEDFWKLYNHHVFTSGYVELMQYTGLKDKNGKEIYEGDKVSFSVFDCFGHDTQYEGYIVYSGSRFMIWKEPDNEYYGDDGGFDLDWVLNQDDEFEIIGNIYEK